MSFVILVTDKEGNSQLFLAPKSLAVFNAEGEKVEIPLDSETQVSLFTAQEFVNAAGSNVKRLTEILSDDHLNQVAEARESRMDQLQQAMEFFGLEPEFDEETEEEPE